MYIGNNNISNTPIAADVASIEKNNDSPDFSKALLAAQASQPTSKESLTGLRSSVAMDTNQGKVNLDIENYLTAPPQPGPIDLMSIPLLLPTEHNINALSKYSEEAFRDLLSEYDIPSPPASIEFDTESKLVLPNDYPYSVELRQALAENPAVEKALHTLGALASHYAGIMEGAAFRDEMTTARNPADQERIVQKYSYLFDDNRPGVEIVLSFLNDGTLLVREKNGDALTQTRQA